MWEQINHARIAERGYQQTGPTMPLEGPVSRSDVQEDLLTVFDKIEAPAGDVVGVQMRDDAVAYVNKLYNEGLLKVWDDVHLLIEQHDGETDPYPEGLEAYSHFAEDDDDDPDQDSDDAHDQCSDDDAEVLGPEAATLPTLTARPLFLPPRWSLVWREESRKPPRPVGSGDEWSR